MMIRQIRFAAAVAFVLAAGASPAHAQTSPHAADAPALFAHSPQYPLLPRDLEIELALSAAPEHLREGATVWVLQPSGYEKAVTGSNAFACMVSRRGGDHFPVCWDEEGTRSLMQLDFEDAKLRIAGKGGADIERLVADGFKSGAYHSPAKPGIAYMLSPLRYRVDETGRATRTPSAPHLMFYAPNVTDAEIGGGRGKQVFINRVGPEGMMIVPVGQKEREQILAASKSLTERVEQALGYRASQ